MAGAIFGMKIYVRPKEAIERVVGGIEQNVESMPEHPSLAFHEIIKKLGNVVPQSPKDVTVMQRRLIRAGMRSENALKTAVRREGGPRRSAARCSLPAS